MISIITSTYNRGYILNNLYNSLMKQTNKNFEWIIINDGSQDNTEELVKTWKPDFSMRYFKQKNGGKHRAINKGVPLAKYDYIFIVDSDDYLPNNSIEIVEKLILSIKDIKNMAGIAGLRMYPDGTSIGAFPKIKTFIDATSLERDKYKITGDKAEIFKKEILLKYPFPEIDGENFIPEGISWLKIAADGYKIRWYPVPIYIGEYLEDGLSKSKNLFVKNFKGYTLLTKTSLRYNKNLNKFMVIARYIDISNQKNINFKEKKELLEIGNFSLLIGYFLHFIRISIKFLVNKGKTNERLNYLKKKEGRI